MPSNYLACTTSAYRPISLHEEGHQEAPRAPSLITLNFLRFYAGIPASAHTLALHSMSNMDLLPSSFCGENHEMIGSQTSAWFLLQHYPYSLAYSKFVVDRHCRHLISSVQRGHVVKCSLHDSKWLRVTNIVLYLRFVLLDSSGEAHTSQRKTPTFTKLPVPMASL